MQGVEQDAVALDVSVRIALLVGPQRVKEDIGGEEIHLADFCCLAKRQQKVGKLRPLIA